MNTPVQQTPTNQEHFLIKERIATLEAALLSSSPSMPTVLRDIHSWLKKDPEVVTILSEDDCAVIVQGLMKVTSATIAAAAIKKAPKKALSKIGLADL